MTLCLRIRILSAASIASIFHPPSFSSTRMQNMVCGWMCHQSDTIRQWLEEKDDLLSVREIPHMKRLLNILINIVLSVILALLPFSQSALHVSAVQASDNEDVYGPILVNRDTAEFLLETASTLEEAGNYINKSAPEIKIADKLRDIYDFADAVQQDLEMSKGKKLTVLTSHTLEQIGRYGLSKTPQIVDMLKKYGKLPAGFNLPSTFGAAEFSTAIGRHIGSGKADIDTIEHYLKGASQATLGVIETLKKTGKLPSTFHMPPTFGAEDFAAAISRHIGSGNADIDTITFYLDGLNQAAWGAVGYMIGGAECARVYQSIAGKGAKMLRIATLPLFEKAVVGWRKQGKILTDQWHTLQLRRIYDGLPVQSITDVYGERVLLTNGLSRTEIRHIDDTARRINQSLMGMKKGLNPEKIDVFKHTGEMELGGVYIDPELIYAGKVGAGTKHDVLKPRPANDMLSWPVDIPDEVVE